MIVKSSEIPSYLSYVLGQGLIFTLSTGAPNTKWAHETGQDSGLLILISIPSTLTLSDFSFLWDKPRIFQDALEALLSPSFSQLLSPLLFLFGYQRGSHPPALPSNEGCVSTCEWRCVKTVEAGLPVFPRVSLPPLSRPRYIRQGEARIVRHSGTHWI